MNKLHVKTGDTVQIISGRDKGKKGKVMAVSTAERKVIVEGCNLVSKHVKPRRMGEPGGIIQAESAIYASKVMHLDPSTGKVCRVGYKMNADGTKTRISRASGKEI